MKPLSLLIRKKFRELAFRTPLGRRMTIPKWSFSMSAEQLTVLAQLVEKTRHVEGDVLEVGVALGWTTLFLNNYMRCRGIDKTYFCIDTFDGFTESDIAVEVKQRGKEPSFYRRAFSMNSQRWFDATMDANGAARVRSIKADAGTYEYSQLPPLSFCLLDVDLYQPSKLALPRIYDRLSVGGVLVVDDCDLSHPQWDGAAQAHREFAANLGEEPDIVAGKLGILVKKARHMRAPAGPLPVTSEGSLATGSA